MPKPCAYRVLGTHTATQYNSRQATLHTGYVRCRETPYRTACRYCGGTSRADEAQRARKACQAEVNFLRSLRPTPEEK